MMMMMMLMLLMMLLLMMLLMMTIFRVVFDTSYPTARAHGTCETASPPYETADVPLQGNQASSAWSPMRSTTSNLT